MIKSLIVIICTMLLSTASYGQFWKDVQKKVEQTAVSSALSEEDAVAGIKEALSKGIEKGVDIVSVTDGYFGNIEIKIPFPEDAKIVEQKMRAMGMDAQVDKVILSINRAAEDAAEGAKPIFVSAIKNMTITDALNIVKGDENAATKYLQNTTYSSLVETFKPVIKTSLDEVDATKYWTDLITAYNKIPFVKKMNPDLPQYVTEKAIDGLFIMVAKEELKIRKDPVARTTELLRKVFGN